VCLHEIHDLLFFLPLSLHLLLNHVILSSLLLFYGFEIFFGVLLGLLIRILTLDPLAILVKVPVILLLFLLRPGVLITGFFPPEDLS
jgi:hypothetical protein